MQIGDCEEAKRYLEDLDTFAQKNNMRDIVDTVEYSTEKLETRIVKVILGGINRRLDSQGESQ